MACLRLGQRNLGCDSNAGASPPVAEPHYIRSQHVEARPNTRELATVASQRSWEVPILGAERRSRASSDASRDNADSDRSDMHSNTRVCNVKTIDDCEEITSTLMHYEMMRRILYTGSDFDRGATGSRERNAHLFSLRSALNVLHYHLRLR
jgi:hypothetical protein